MYKNFPRFNMTLRKTSFLASLIWLIILEIHGENATEHGHEHHHPGVFGHYADHDPSNESFEWAQDERLVPDPVRHNVVEALLQLWWSQRGFVHSARHEKDELRRVKLVRVDRLDDMMDEIDRTIEDQISSMSLWDQPATEQPRMNAVNKTLIDEMQRKWKEIETFFSRYEIDGAQDICTRFTQELRAAQEDLPRRWAHLERMMIEIEEQEKQENRSKS